MKKDKVHLKDILDVISDIESFTKGVFEEEFYKSKEKQYAVLRGLEIIGEATKNVSKDLKAKYRQIHWKDIAGMRDKLIHMYFGVKLDLVWKTVEDKLPELKEQVCKILEEFQE